jgi:hypothetical protein
LLAGSTIGAVIVGSLSTSATTGCTTHECDPSSYTWSGGAAIDENTYETTQIDQPWLSYPPMVAITVNFPPFFNGRRGAWLDVYLGTDATPNGGADFVFGDGYTTAAGYEAIYNFFGAPNGNSVLISNGTCARYFMRAVAHFVPVDGGMSEEDAEPQDGAIEATSPGGGKSGHNEPDSGAN